MLYNIFWNNKWRIGISYALLLIEFSVFAILPFLMGLAVDGVIAGDKKNFNLWIGVSVFALVAGFTRRRFDNRAFLHIWSKKATEIINGLIAKNVDRTKIVSRSYMVKEFAHFLEFTIPAVVSAIIDISVSLAMLWIFVPSVGFWMLLLAFLAVTTCYVFSIYINRMEIICQHGREKIADSIMIDNTLGVENGYEDQRRSYVRYSDLDASSWGLLDIIATAGLVIVIFSSSECTAGMVMANLTYCQKLFDKSCFVSHFFKHYKQVNTWTEFLKNEEGVAVK